MLDNESAAGYMGSRCVSRSKNPMIRKGRDWNEMTGVHPMQMNHVGNSKILFPSLLAKRFLKPPQSSFQQAFC